MIWKFGEIQRGIFWKKIKPKRIRIWNFENFQNKIKKSKMILIRCLGVEHFEKLGKRIIRQFGNKNCEN